LRLGSAASGASLWAAPFFIELEDYNGEYAAGKKAHPPERNAGDDQSLANQPNPDLHQGRRVGDRVRQEERSDCRAEGRPAGDGARCRPWSYPQEHGFQEIFPAIQASCIARLKSHPKRALFEPSGNRRLVPFLDRKKNAAIPAIRTPVNEEQIIEMAVYRQFLKIWPVSYVKSHYFTSVKNRHLHAA
jgi:hypothetical protein